MEIMLIILVSILLLICLVLLFLVMFKRNKVEMDGGAANLLKESLSAEAKTGVSETKLFISGLVAENSRAVNDIEKKLIEKLTEAQTDIKDNSSAQSKEIREKFDGDSKELRTVLKGLTDSTHPIADVKDKVDKLDILLSQNNKAGKAGEYLLERMLDNLTGNSSHNNLLFERQYTLQKRDGDKGLIADVFIKGQGGKFSNIPIDAKFPFNAYLKLTSMVEGEGTYDSQFKEFERDVAARIKETTKYISQEDNTVYAIMFIPSESIYSFICANTTLIDKAFKERVIIAGPSTLMAIIQSVDQYMSLFDNINNYSKKVKNLDKAISYLNTYDEAIQEFGKGLEKINKAYASINTRNTSLRKKFDELNKDIEE